jgi:hypothetical protein
MFAFCIYTDETLNMQHLTVGCYPLLEHKKLSTHKRRGSLLFGKGHCRKSISSPYTRTRVDPCTKAG